MAPQRLPSPEARAALTASSRSASALSRSAGSAAAAVSVAVSAASDTGAEERSGPSFSGAGLDCELQSFRNLIQQVGINPGAQAEPKQRLTQGRCNLHRREHGAVLHGSRAASTAAAAGDMTAGQFADQASSGKGTPSAVVTRQARWWGRRGADSACNTVTPRISSKPAWSRSRQRDSCVVDPGGVASANGSKRGRLLIASAKPPIRPPVRSPHVAPFLTTAPLQRLLNQPIALQ